MLEKAAIGIAMGNAADNVKAKANDTTLDNNNDGIAIALSKYKLISDEF